MSEEEEHADPVVESAVKNIELGSIPNFDCTGDPTSLGTHWNKWIRSFKFFLTAKGVDSAKQKHALLLHCAGFDVQDIFEILVDTGNDEDYNTALDALDGYFKESLNMKGTC